jgi:hypothetical protein
MLAVLGSTSSRAVSDTVEKMNASLVVVTIRRVQW